MTQTWHSTKPNGLEETKSVSLLRQQNRLLDVIHVAKNSKNLVQIVGIFNGIQSNKVTLKAGYFNPLLESKQRSMVRFAVVGFRESNKPVQ